MMRGKFNVLFVSSEIRPFVQGGCTAEFSGTFPKFIKNLGHDIRLMMPNYKLINERKFVLRDVIRLQGMDIKIADKQIKTNGKSSFLPEAKVQIYFLDNKYYFDREGLYEDPASGKEYKDNPERFMYFCKSCLETLKMLHWQPDVIHCNDWQTALIPVYLKTLYKEDPFFKNTHTLLTIHDFTTQGNYNFKNNLLAHELELLGLALEGSFLKDGIRYADLLNTISEAHLQEVRKNEGFNFNLADVLNEKKDEISTILNGVDADKWNPESDSLIPHKFSKRDLSGKLENKKLLTQTFGLEYNENIPIICFISPFHQLKGLDLLIDSIGQILDLDLQMVVAGNYPNEYLKSFQQLVKKFNKKLSFKGEVTDKLIHLILAGSDLCLLPSKIESCTFIHLYGLKYGTIPLARNTGLFRDTLQDFNAADNSGTAILFKKYETKELINAVKKAIKFFRNKVVWEQLALNGMKQDFSWKTSIQKYIKLYQKLHNTNHKKSKSKKQ